MARGNGRLIRLSPEEAGVTVIDLTKMHARRIEPDHHPRIHAYYDRRIEVDRFEMHQAAAGLAIVKGEVSIAPAVDRRSLRAQFREQFRLVGAVIVGPEGSIAPA